MAKSYKLLFLKNIFMVKRMYKIFLIKIAVDNNLFQHLRIDTLKAFRTIPPRTIAPRTIAPRTLPT